MAERAAQRRTEYKAVPAVDKNKRRQELLERQRVARRNFQEHARRLALAALERDDPGYKSDADPEKASVATAHV